MSGNVVWNGLVPQSALGIQRRDKQPLWTMEMASSQRSFSNQSLDILHCFEWGGNASEDTDNENKAENLGQQQCLDINRI